MMGSFSATASRARRARRARWGPLEPEPRKGLFSNVWLLIKWYMFRKNDLFLRNCVFGTFQKICNFATTLPDQTATLPDHMERHVSQRCVFAKMIFLYKNDWNLRSFGATAEKSTTWKMYIGMEHPTWKRIIFRTNHGIPYLFVR